MEDRYWIALFKEGGESAGVDRELAREHVLNIAQSKYKQSAALYPNRIVMLCDRATVLARSDRTPAYTAMRRRMSGLATGTPARRYCLPPCSLHTSS